MRQVPLALALALSSCTGAAAQTYLVIVSGLGGEARYSAAFTQWGNSLVAAARDRFALPPERIIYLVESPDSNPAATDRSSKENVEATLNRLAMEAEATALVVIVLFGHGSAVAGAPRINLPGPDMTADDFAALLARFPSQQIVFANLTSASGDFVPVVAGDRRVVLTATQSGRERHESIFAGHFVDAFAAEGADVDKDNRVSLLEAFEYARQEVVRVYESENRLLTEHALLDDNGDGEGSTKPGINATDGLRAARIFLEPAVSVAVDAAADAELTALYETRRELEEAVVTLRARRGQMSDEQYQLELERLLLELARTSRAIREREERNPE